MNAQDLKNSILQLAIQGKLVEQREEEGTALELIEQIKEEKDKLIKAGKIPKERNLPIISEEEKIFELPNNWQYVRVQDIASYITDYVANGSFATLKKNTKTFKTKNYALFVRTMDLTSNFKGECSYIDKSSYDFLGKSKLYGGELILPNIGASIGKAFLMPDLKMPMSLAPNSIMIKFLHPIMNKFFSFVIQSPYGATFLRDTKGGTATPKFSKTELRNMVILLPPLKEIVRIVAKIEELMPYVDQYDVAYSEVEELNKKFPEDMLKSILQYAIQGKLVEQREEDGTAEDLYKQIQEEKKKLIEEGKIKKAKALSEITENEIPFDIPDNWKWVRLADVSENIHYGYTASANEVGNCKLLRITDIQNNSVDWDSVPYCNIKDKDYLTYGLKNRDIMIARTGGTIGKTYIVESLNDRAVFASYLIRVVPVNSINEKYLKKFMESPLYWHQLKAGSMGTGQPNVNGTTLSKLILPLPPLAEQERIVEEIENLLPYTKQLVK